MPSSTTQGVKYALSGLCWKGGTALEKRFLSYNLGFEPMKLATGQATIGDLRGKEYSMPDLTAFLCAFSAGFKDLSNLTYASLTDENGVMVLRRGPDSKIPVRELEVPRIVDKLEVQRILNELRVDWEDAT